MMFSLIKNDSSYIAWVVFNRFGLHKNALGFLRLRPKPADKNLN